jgi:3D (Asp-Asp-Asp) domain-containing protein
MYLLRVCLLREFGKNEIGDVEEEYRKRLQAEDGKAVRRWFWVQVISTVGISLRSPETARALLGRMSTRPSMIHSTISMGFFCLVAVMVFVPSRVNVGALSPEPTVIETPAPSRTYTATAYSMRGRTSSGKPVSRGLVAADPRVLPLGTRVRVEAGEFSGEYLVADTGGAVRGRRIDIWTPTADEALRFGRRPVKLTVLGKLPT